MHYCITQHTNVSVLGDNVQAGRCVSLRRHCLKAIRMKHGGAGTHRPTCRHERRLRLIRQVVLLIY